ncbi:nucleoside diphosphate-linked moiety X motif 19 [Esox lucius]|uniref:Acyl-coenzyme A diphosphatase NUDT19 n=1 Tax=Esox lucius TaxID=8010 RepID=A0A3P9AAY9_ESOLU|nr:nucleoside diphosphate-linked moiety X motif 19 [Esox lucius]
MNTALRHWKEAATVILAAGTRHKLTVDNLTRCVDEASATAIKADSNLPDKSPFDYEVLLLRRSRTSGFMPNAYVFPGGLVESSDFSSEWLEVFKSFRRLPNFGLGFVKQPPETRPPIFATDRMKLGSPIPGDVGFRICAVRETFEESGVLLIVPKYEERHLLNSIEKKTGGPPELTTTTDICNKDELAKWRALVNENPSNFIKMCRELECLPNIWALREWGNWLTPSGKYGKQRRYDTAFYICCLQEKPPHTFQDEQEIVHFEWSTPAEVLQRYQDRDMWIAPPQFYNLSQMCRLPSLLDLHSFSTQRAAEGCEQWLPIHLVSEKYYVALLPGDELYPEDGSGQIKSLNTNQSLEKLLDEGSVLHRLMVSDPYSIAALVTITPKYRHLLPVTGPGLKHRIINKL